VHNSLNRDVVIKTPNEELKSEPDYSKYVERFIKEAQLLAKLCKNPHPHIVWVIDLFEEGDSHCLVMDFILGESLSDFVRRRGALPEAQAVEYICQIGSALSAVHREGLVHWDAHPKNIMLRNNSKAVLIDFGLAGEIIPATSFSKGFGHRGFAPYEQITKGIRHPTVDIYTLAASLYYAVTGQLPTNSFDRNDGVKLVSPKRLVPSISDKLNQAILQGMALEASDRPQSIEEWLKLLPSQDVSKTPSIQKLSSTVSTPPPQKLPSISRGWLTRAFSLISWASPQRIILEAKNYLRSIRQSLKSLISRFTLKSRKLLIHQEFSFKANTRLHRPIRSIPWGWLTGACITYAFTGLLCARSASPTWALALAGVGALAGASTSSEDSAENRPMTMALQLAVAAPSLVIGVGSLVVAGGYFAAALGYIAVFLALLGVVIWAVSLLLPLLGILFGVRAEAEAIAQMLVGASKWLVTFGLTVIHAVIKTVIKAVTWVLAGGWVGVTTAVIAWILAIACFLVLAETLAWVGEKQLKSFSRFHAFLILVVTSWAGLGLGCLATFYVSVKP
jgi:serine/threonine protein kinase